MLDAKDGPAIETVYGPPPPPRTVPEIEESPGIGIGVAVGVAGIVVGVAVGDRGVAVGVGVEAGPVRVSDLSQPAAKTPMMAKPTAKARFVWARIV